MKSMQETNAQSNNRRMGYRQLTRSPLNNLVLILPLLIFFQIGSSIYGTDLLLMTPQYLRGILEFFGASASFLPALLIAAVLLVQHLAHKDPWTIHPQVLAGMVGESIIWTIPLIAISYLTGKMAAIATAVSPEVHHLLQNALIAVGAGLYEEFMFRMILISLIMLLLVDLIGLRKDAMTVLAVLAAAILFSLCHFTFFHGASEFKWGRFIFLFTAGVLWGSIFIFRGFAIAVGSHILWDIFVLVAAPKNPFGL
jgi:membrane protease YdiL (CAAX protease family)